MANLHRKLFEEPLIIGANTQTSTPAFAQPRPQATSPVGRVLESFAPAVNDLGRALNQGLSPITPRAQLEQQTQQSLLPSTVKSIQQKEAIKSGGTLLAEDKALLFNPAGIIKKTVATQAPKVFKGFTDLSTKLLEKLKGRTTVSRQFIEDLSNSPDLKQAERDLIRRMLPDEKEISVPDFANKVKSELLPLKFNRSSTDLVDGPPPRYENITLSDELRGPIAKYDEHIYESPIKTSAGRVHFDSQTPNYFAHTRIEDLPAETMRMSDGIKSGAKMLRNPSGGAVMGKEGLTRRVIELQSDLFQKGRLEQEGTVSILSPKEAVKMLGEKEGAEYTALDKLYKKAHWDMTKEQQTRHLELLKKVQTLTQEGPIKQLEPYRNTWHERVIREEVKQAAKDGKTKLQFPTGETAMKIEGLGTTNNWYVGTEKLKPEMLEVGKPIQMSAFHDNGSSWIITDVLGDGKFKAVPKDRLRQEIKASRGLDVEGDLGETSVNFARENLRGFDSMLETFDISGKVDTENPIYKFYEKEIGKYLKNKYGAELVTDPQGVKWYEVNIKPEMGKLPIEAFGAGVFPLINQQNARSSPQTNEKRDRVLKTKIEPLFINARN